MSAAPLQSEPQDVIDAFRQQRDIMANDAAYVRAAVAARDREIERLREELAKALADLCAKSGAPEPTTEAA